MHKSIAGRLIWLFGVSSLLTIASVRAAENVAYLSTQDGVAVIDLAKLEVVREIHVGGSGARGLAITPDGKYLLTANQGTADVSVIDTRSFDVVRRIPIGKNPEFMRIQPDGTKAYVTYEPASPGGPPSKEVEGKKDGKRPEKGTPAEVAVIDLQKWVATSFLAGGMETEGIEFSADGKNVSVANEGDDTITMYRKLTGKLIKTIDVRPYGSRPRGIKIAPDGHIYVVTMENSDNLLVLDPKLNVIKAVATEKGPYGVAFDRSGKRIFVAAARSKVLQVLDALTFEPIASIPMGDRCWHFSFTPDEARILVACGRSNDVRVIDAAKYETIKVITGLKLPWGAVTYPKASGTLDTP